MKLKKIIIIIILIILFSLIIFYFLIKENTLKEVNTSVLDIETTIDIENEEIDWSSYENKEITLTDSIKITDAGIYTLSGTINDGLITIDTSSNVKLILNNVSINNNNGPAILVLNANKIVITTLSGTVNTLSDSSTYSNYDSDIEGAIYSKDDLVLEGSGTLIINGNKGDGIVCKDNLKITSGTYNITSLDDGIRGTDSVYILDGTFNITSSGDGIKSTNETDSLKGYVNILNGIFNITTKLDGIQGVGKVLIENGTFNITTTCSINNSTTSCKGIKSEDNIVITDGTFNLDTTDDSIHSNNYIGILNGNYKISSGDDGIHADSNIIIDGGDINISKSYEGIEGNSIIINNGNINIVSSDDGINIASSSSNINYLEKSNNSLALTINGGIIHIDANGDGLDANGSIYITGGTIFVSGPTNSANGAIDYDFELKITGGTLIATSARGMNQGISNSSTQYGVLINFLNDYPSGTIISIEDELENEIMTYESTKSFSSLVFSSSDLTTNTYQIKINDELYQTFTIKNISTTITNSNLNQGPNQRRTR